MKPFSLEIRDLYLKSGEVWRWSYDESFQTPFEQIMVAWRESFNEDLPDELPEPYDFQGGDLLYVFPLMRYLLISRRNGAFDGAEIRELQDVFIIRREPRTEKSIIACIGARSPSHAIIKAQEYMNQNPSEGSWTLWHQSRDSSLEPQIIYRSTT